MNAPPQVKAGEELTFDHSVFAATPVKEAFSQEEEAPGIEEESIEEAPMMELEQPMEAPAAPEPEVEAMEEDPAPAEAEAMEEDDLVSEPAVEPAAARAELELRS